MKPEKEEIINYCLELASLMRLGDWEFFCGDPEADEEDVLAKIDIVYGRKIAYIEIFSPLWTTTHEQQRHTFVHELMHLHMWGMWTMATVDLEPHLAPQMHDLFVSLFRTNLEQAVDETACLVEDTLPFPPWCDDESDAGRI